MESMHDSCNICAESSHTQHRHRIHETRSTKLTYSKAEMKTLRNNDKERVALEKKKKIKKAVQKPHCAVSSWQMKRFHIVHSQFLMFHVLICVSVAQMDQKVGTNNCTVLYSPTPKEQRKRFRQTDQSNLCLIRCTDCHMVSTVSQPFQHYNEFHKLMGWRQTWCGFKDM